MRPFVLLVDDRPTNLDLLEAILVGLDIDIGRAASGIEAVTWSAQKEPAVVLLDVQMPGMDGFETAHMLRRGEGRAHVPIIFVTAQDADAERMFDAYTSGGVDYLRKPIAPAILRAKVRTFADLRRKNEEIEELSERLRMSNADLRRFAHAISHDLREPVRTMLSFTGFLEADYGGGRIDATFDEHLRFVTHAATRMRTMIDSLLELSRVGQSTSLEMVALDRALDGALANLKSAIDASGARIERSPLPTAAGDEAQLVQLFQNLVGNAIKFRGEGPPAVRIEATPGEDRHRISVSDGGIGIARVDHRRIFGVFRRLHGDEEYEGTGVGLALVERVVENHGGSIEVESSLGEGATFHFTLAAALPARHRPDDGDLA